MEMYGSEFIAETIRRHGIDHVFFVEAIARHTLIEMEKRGIKRILAHSEKAAAYMADGYARAGNTFGVCMAQSVGAANLAAGLQDGFLGHTPILAITGRKPFQYQFRNSYQEISHPDIFKAVTKSSKAVTDTSQLNHLLPQAIREAVSGTPGPVHLDLLGYRGNLTDEAKAELRLTPPLFKELPLYRPIPANIEAEAALTLLSQAKTPLLIVGRGAVQSRALFEIQTLAEMLSLPIACSMDAKEVLPDNHPLYVGAVGTYCRPCANRIAAEADLIFFIGCGTGDQVTNNWTIGNDKTKFIQLDINPSEIGKNYPGTLGICGDAREGIALITNLLAGKGISKPTAEWAEKAGGMVTEWRDSVRTLIESDSLPMRSERLCRELSDSLPKNAIVIADTGYSAIWAGQLLNFTSSDQRLIRASGSLGWALPASIGAKCACPDCPVICFTGDGALWYHISELDTAVRNSIPFVIVVNNNSSLGQCRIGVERAYDEKGVKGGSKDQYEFRKTDFYKIAEDMGAFGIRVEKPREIASALDKAFNSGRPSLIDVITEPHCDPVTK